MVTPKKPLPAWSMVCKPKINGGLGVLNLQIQNKALLTKQLHRFYTKVDVYCVSLTYI